jgi:methionine--tRNA ligase beta chain
MEEKSPIAYEDFAKLDVRVGTILSAEIVAGSEKLLKTIVDVGEENPRQILAGIQKSYSPEALIGKRVVVLTNLLPKKMLGLFSEGMLLATGEEQVVLLEPPAGVAVGLRIR